jgi:hypothetical protein
MALGAGIRDDEANRIGPPRHRGAALNSEIHRCLGITNFFGLRARAVANNENVRFT